MKKKKFKVIFLAVLFLQIIGCQKENSITSPNPNLELSGKIVFSPGGSIYMLDLNSSELPLTTITDGGEPRVNPPGTTIVYDKISPQGRYNIYSVSLAGGEPTNLTNQTIGSDSWPDWSPDGNSIVFNRAYHPMEALCVMNKDGSNLHALTDTATLARAMMPRWSPDGSKIAFVGLADYLAKEPVYYLNTISLDGSNLQIFDETVISTLPRWSPDSKKIAYGKSYQFASNDTTSGGIFIVDIDSKVTRNANHGLYLSLSGFSWLSNDCLVYVGYNLADKSYQVYRMPISSLPAEQAGSESNTLIASGFKANPTTFISPDGRFIGIFGQRTDDKTLTLYIANSDGTNFRKLKDTGLNITYLQDDYSQWIK